MSQQQPPPDRSSTGPSEEQVRAYLSELRDADVGDIVAQVLSTLLNGAQVKLGRPDARVLIDTAAAVVDRVGPRLDDSFTSEVSSILSQLRVAQVEAEKKAGAAAGEDQDEPADAGTAQQQTGDEPRRGAARQPQQEDRSSTEAGQGGSRLWVPPGARGT